MAAISGFGMVDATSAMAQACPAAGKDTLGCELLITINPDLTTTISDGPAFSQGPYDGSDDTLIGVINNADVPITSLHITGPGGGGPTSGSGILGFDADGVDSSAYLNLSADNGSAPTYGYSGTDSATGTFDLSGPLNTYENLMNGGSGGTDSFDLEFGGGVLAGGATGACVAAGGSAFFSLERPAFSAATIGAGAPVQCPEPASLAILGVALTGLGLVRRRRQA